MEDERQNRCRAALKRWLKFASDNLLRHVSGHPELAYYGTGESAHWAVQSNMNVVAALAVAGVEEADPAMVERALSLFRYAMRTHVTGDLAATDGAQWGRHWISVLGAERMTHGVNALEPYFTAEDRERYRAFRFSEADFLLREYPVKANMLNSSGENRPESNIWNGGFLWRAALDYPDAPDAALWREKGTRFLLNGISHALDAASEQRFDGRPLREWHVGFNFTPNYSLDHHGYMNVGYSIICLSNLAMLYFNFRERGQRLPEALSLHVDDLWRTVKNFFFDDGRLLRIGGDTRARYTYCQCYALPALWLAAEFLRDADAVRLRARYLELLLREQECNRDGSFYGERLRGIREQSTYYYTRLESDPALVLSQDLRWRRFAALPEPAAEPLPECLWSDPFHGAYLRKNRRAVRSFVQRGAAGPMALCLPADRSDLAEWEGNLFCRIGLHRCEVRQGRSSGRVGADCFVHCGSVTYVESQPYGEGEGHYPVAESRFAVAAPPDGRSMLLLERVVVLKESTFDRVIPVNLQIPNDLYNGFRRSYRAERECRETAALPDAAETIDTGCRKLTIEGRLTVAALGGVESLWIFRPAEREAALLHAPALKSLYIETVGGDAGAPFRRYPAGTVLADTATALAVDAPETFAADGEFLSTADGVRGVRIRGVDGVQYRLLANFGDGEAEASGVLLAAGEAVLQQEVPGGFETI